MASERRESCQAALLSQHHTPPRLPDLPGTNSTGPSKVLLPHRPPCPGWYRFTSPPDPQPHICFQSQRLLSEAWLLSFPISGLKTAIVLCHFFLDYAATLVPSSFIKPLPRVATWSIFPRWSTSTLSIRLNYLPYSLPGDQEFGTLPYS